MTEMLKLFQVTTVVKELKGHRNVPVSWYRHKPKHGERSYQQLIADYSADDEYAGYAEACIDEDFTEDEAKQLKAYLDGIDGGYPAVIREVSLPIGNNGMPLSAMPAGGGPDHLMFADDPGWPLPFEVWGYFDTRFCERVPDDAPLGIPF
jgi:hypothetical protein